MCRWQFAPKLTLFNSDLIKHDAISARVARYQV